MNNKIHRHYYKTILKVQVFSTTPLKGDTIEDLTFYVANGDLYPSKMLDPEEEELTAQEMAEELNDCGLEPNLLKLSDDGEEL